METISELRAKAAELRRIAEKLEDAAKSLANLSGAKLGMDSLYLSLPSGSNLGGFSGIDAIQIVMQEAGFPLSKPEILNRLGERGKAIGENTLAAYLSKEPRFKSYGEGKWGLS